MTRLTWKTACWLALLPAIVATLRAESPHAIDKRLTVELFAEHPQIVTPTGLAVDARGRVFVAESHTHFRPDNYDGPKADRILIFEDTDHDGRADKTTIFHEGFVHVMDIEFHHDGSLYVASRMNIQRLRDTNGDDQADEITPIVRMETKGNYPHNGLSGIAFLFSGGFHFGLGENLGESYTLIGSDGTRITGGGEGGSTYFVDSDGRKLRRVSTGWWNPYGMCADSFGRVFGTDNDPDASPPCRLIQVVEGGDYGYEFRYGRSGRNPLITWDGELPGTLPMIAGTGEAPCHIIAYESDALPDEYFGDLLVPSWADHRIEHYRLTARANRGLVETARQTFVDGPDDFRPVGIDVAPDGTIYVSDWVSSSYTLHKLGRIWRILPREFTPKPRPTDPAAALTAPDRRVREAAARQLQESDAVQETVREVVSSSAVPQLRATAIEALRPESLAALSHRIIIDANSPLELRIAATQSAIRQGVKFKLDASLPVPLQIEFLRAPNVQLDPAVLHATSDPALWLAFIDRLAAQSSTGKPAPGGVPPLATLLAAKKRTVVIDDQSRPLLAAVLASDELALRLAAIKWIADAQDKPSRDALEKLLASKQLDVATYLAIQVALQRIAGQPVTDRPAPDRLLATVTDEQTTPALRRLALRLIPTDFAGLKVEALTALTAHADEALRGEAVRSLALHADDKRFATLSRLAGDDKQPASLRADAVLGLALASEKYLDLLVNLSAYDDRGLRDEALRALIATPLSAEQTAKLQAVAARHPNSAEAAKRAVDRLAPQRPDTNDLASWEKLLTETGDPRIGERLFFGTKIGICAKCHQVGGRGSAVGPDLSTIDRRVASAGADGTRWLLETTIQPSKQIGPQYVPWIIVTTDGRQFTGLPRRKGGNAEAYLGLDGKEFTLKKSDIEFHRERDVSIMPADLLNSFTKQELADLFAFLRESR